MSNKRLLPRTPEGWVGFLERSSDCEEPLSLVDLARCLWGIGVVRVGEYSDLIAHLTYPGLPPCPLRIETKPAGDGWPSVHALELLGHDMMKTYRQYAPAQNILVVGVPHSGTVLARGVESGWYKQEDAQAQLIAMRKTGKGFHLFLPPEGTISNLVVPADNAASTGISAGRAVAAIRRHSGLVVHDFLTLVDRGEGASQALEAMGVKLVCAIRLVTLAAILASYRLIPKEVPQRLKAYRKAVLAAQAN